MIKYNYLNIQLVIIHINMHPTKGHYFSLSPCNTSYLCNLTKYISDHKDYIPVYPYHLFILDLLHAN